ncbi:MAG: hypothetical protein AB1665_00485 [Candidatus Thermoplasmatota archaeon]
MKKRTLGTALRTAFGHDHLFKRAVTRGEGKRSLLMSRDRMEIFSHLTMRPCSSQRVTGRAVGLSAPSAARHLRLLGEMEYLNSFAYGRSQRYFVLEMIAPSDRERFALLAEEKARQALLMVVRVGKVRQSAAIQEMKISQQAAALVMRRLEAHGFVEAQRARGETYYTQSMELEAMIRFYAERADGFKQSMLSLLRRDGVMPVMRRRKKGLLFVEVDQGAERAVVRLDTNPLSFLR